jgi:hypothetical protein
MHRDIYALPFDSLTQEEQIIRTTSGKLIKHVRGLEDAGFIEREIASNLIGCVKKLTGVALSEHWARAYPQIIE